MGKCDSPCSKIVGLVTTCVTTGILLPSIHKFKQYRNDKSLHIVAGGNPCVNVGIYIKKMIFLVGLSFTVIRNIKSFLKIGLEFKLFELECTVNLLRINQRKRTNQLIPVLAKRQKDLTVHRNECDLNPFCLSTEDL